MLNLKKIILACGVGAIIALTGCQSSSTQGQGGRSAGRTIDDKTITETVKKQLDEDPAYKFSNVNVSTFNGVVQLSGFVATDGQKSRAQQVAQGTQGVNQVINNISLKQPAYLAPTSRTTTTY